ncbi:MAG: DUF5320 domain-containing protein [Deltaproteobacteria bacterium]|nr:DUF5320 domain-containing protein [Deltaproteobacteria bacterium]
MPRGDGTGPAGLGPKSGRGLGGCGMRAGDRGTAGAVADLRSGFRRAAGPADSRATGVEGGGRGIGAVLLELFLCGLERVTRKYQRTTRPNLGK